jgi:S1-C subfamily serine protease
MKHFIIFIQIVGLISLIAACAGMQEPAETPTLMASNTPTATAVPTNTPTLPPTNTPTLTPSPTSTPTLTPTPAPLTSKEIFNLVSPSVAYVETTTGHGSGILLNGGMILTNAHVIWPFDEVRVIFPDGTEFENVPVANRDLLADLAILGPVETEIQAVELVAMEDLDIGSDVYLLGYPGEVEQYPKPAITSGLISRVREWEPAGVTYYQTDATIGGGQSGGMLVTEMGDVIGMSSYLFSDAGFGLVASAADILPRVERLLAGEDIDGLQGRSIPPGKGQYGFYPIAMNNEWDQAIYVIQEPEETLVGFKVDGGASDVGFKVIDVFGNAIAEVDQTYEGEENGEFLAELDAPYFVILHLYSSEPVEDILINSTSRMVELIDLDDGKAIEKGEVVYGNLDFPGDFDKYEMSLAEGDEINVQVRSISLDPMILILRVGDSPEQLVGDDNSGGGIFGVDAEMSFSAPESGTYQLIVADSYNISFGGYSIEVGDRYEGAPTPMAPLPTPEAVDTEFGDMVVYTTPSTDLMFLYPHDWTRYAAYQSIVSEACIEVTDCFGKENTVLVVLDEDLAGLTITEDDYLEMLLSTVEDPGLTVSSVEEFVTDSGLSGYEITIQFSEILSAKRLVIFRGDKAFNLTFMGVSSEIEQYWPLVEFVFSSIKEAE